MAWIQLQDINTGNFVRFNTNNIVNYGSDITGSVIRTVECLSNEGYSVYESPEQIDVIIANTEVDVMICQAKINKDNL